MAKCEVGISCGCDDMDVNGTGAGAVDVNVAPYIDLPPNLSFLTC
jgi:hypothetical protein